MKWEKKILRWINKRTMANSLDYHPLTGDLIQLSGGELWEIENTSLTPTVPTGFVLEISLDGEIKLCKAMILQVETQLPGDIRIWRKSIIADTVLRAAGMATTESYYMGSPPSLDIVEKLVRIDQYLRNYDSDTIANLLAQLLLTHPRLSSVVIVQSVKQIEQQNWVNVNPPLITRSHSTLPSSKNGEIVGPSKEDADMIEQIKHKFCQYLETQPEWVFAYKDVSILD